MEVMVKKQKTRHSCNLYDMFSSHIYSHIHNDLRKSEPTE